MIEQTVDELTPLVGTRPACRPGIAHAGRGFPASVRAAGRGEDDPALATGKG
jgi:hypothetical protein